MTGDVTQVVKHLPGKFKTLCSNPHYCQKKKKKKRTEGRKEKERKEERKRKEEPYINCQVWQLIHAGLLFKARP
jgi:tRNA1(Val) A37 N6-methylase TrmN6